MTIGITVACTYWRLFRPWSLQITETRAYQRTAFAMINYSNICKKSTPCANLPIQSFPIHISPSRLHHSFAAHNFHTNISSHSIALISGIVSESFWWIILNKLNDGALHWESFLGSLFRIFYMLFSLSFSSIKRGFSKNWLHVYGFALNFPFLLLPCHEKKHSRRKTKWKGSEPLSSFQTVCSWDAMKSAQADLSAQQKWLCESNAIMAHRHSILLAIYHKNGIDKMIAIYRHRPWHVEQLNYITLWAFLLRVRFQLVIHIYGKTIERYANESINSRKGNSNNNTITI